ncbi:MAG: beta-propeller fold lactonase family protein [Candidatus Dormibacteraeota bacterium]|nr:beta-propeller fold lactonase family protein [Candidatus Dormibacteraeota bacterium]
MQLACVLAIVVEYVTPVPASASSGFTAFVANEGSNSVSVLDSGSNAVVASVTSGMNLPAGVAVTPDAKTAYVANHGGSPPVVTPIDVATNTAGSPISLPSGVGPFAIAISPDGATAYVTDKGNSTVTPIKLATRTVGTAISVGSGPEAIAITPDGATAYVADMNTSAVSTINLATNAVGSVTVGRLPTGVAITPDGKSAYVSNFGSNTVSVIAIATNTVSATIPTGTEPAGVAITPDGTTGLVADYGSADVTRFATATNTAVGTVPAGNSPFGLAITPDGARAYVTDNVSAGTVTPIDIGSSSALAAITVGSNPVGIAIAPASGPTISSEASASVPAGGRIHDTATLSGGQRPVGTINFALFGPGDASCASPVATSQATVNGNGAYTSAEFTTALPGTYEWRASYSGDASDRAAGPTSCTDPAESVVVTPQTLTGEAFGATGQLNVLVLGVHLSRTPDAGPVSTTTAGTTGSCVASVQIVVSAHTLCAHVTTTVGPATSTGQASIADATISIAGVPLITLTGVSATSQTSCQGSSGSTTITGLTIGGLPRDTSSLRPGTAIDLGVATLVLNEQTAVTGADRGLTVDAVHLIVRSLVTRADVVLASATSDISNCP